MTTINKDAGNIYRQLLEAGFGDKYAQFITAQAAHETANFTSYIYKHNFNAFGMKYQGQETAKGERNGYAFYNGYNESVADYDRLIKSYAFLAARTNVGTVESFVSFLKKMKYFEAPLANYLSGVKFFLKQYFPNGELHTDLVIHGGGGTW